METIVIYCAYLFEGRAVENGRKLRKQFRQGCEGWPVVVVGECVPSRGQLIWG